MRISGISVLAAATVALTAACAGPANAETSVGYDVACGSPNGVSHTIIVHFLVTEGGEYSTMVIDEGGVKVVGDHSNQFQVGKGGDLKVIVGASQTGTIVALKRMPGSDEAKVINWKDLRELIDLC